MGSMSTAPYQEFAGRLHRALDRAKFPAERSRTGALATRYAVTRETARKWLSGLALPEMDRMIRLSTDFRVSFEWLATGRGEMAIDASFRVEEPRPNYGAAGDCARLYAWIDGMTDKQRKGLLQLLGID